MRPRLLLVVAQPGNLSGCDFGHFFGLRWWLASRWCLAVSEPSLMALLWRVLMCGGGWFGLSSFFLGRQYATLGPEAL